jgi:hypothetical protein
MKTCAACSGPIEPAYDCGTLCESCLCDVWGSLGICGSTSIIGDEKERKKPLFEYDDFVTETLTKEVER